MYTRFAKVGLVWSIALYTSLVALNNIMDYGSNYDFVTHVMKMDTTFPDNKAMWRSIDSTFLHHTTYVFIIFFEAVTAMLCWIGGARLFKVVRDIPAFNKNKGIAITGLMVGFFLWFTLFITMAGEWFLMWQSKTWNGLQPAFRLTILICAVLLFLCANDDEKNS